MVRRVYLRVLAHVEEQQREAADEGIRRPTAGEQRVVRHQVAVPRALPRHLA